MAWCIVKEEQSLEVTFGQAFKNVDGGVDLREDFLSAEIPIAILAGFEDDPCFPAEKSVKKRKGG
jgi:hypothetical protein